MLDFSVIKPVRTLIKRLATRMGYEIAKPPKTLLPDSRFGLDVLGLLVDSLVAIRDPEKLYLLQIGANDGKVDDAVRPVLERYRIPALLCEPLPISFLNLQDTYRGFDHVALSRCAIGPEVAPEKRTS